MPISQLSVFAENKPGAITDITRTLGDAGVDIRALSLADTSDYGILRLIVSDDGTARRVLEAKGYILRLSPVLAVAMADRPGALGHILQALEDEGMNIEYMYASIARTEEDAYVILRVADPERAEALLTRMGCKLISREQVGSGWQSAPRE